MISKIMILST